MLAAGVSGGPLLPLAPPAAFPGAAPAGSLLFWKASRHSPLPRPPPAARVGLTTSFLSKSRGADSLGWGHPVCRKINRQLKPGCESEETAGLRSPDNEREAAFAEVPPSSLQRPFQPAPPPPFLSLQPDPSPPPPTTRFWLFAFWVHLSFRCFTPFLFF